jgi:hypothetical protein
LNVFQLPSTRSQFIVSLLLILIAPPKPAIVRVNTALKQFVPNGCVRPLRQNRAK